MNDFDFIANSAIAAKNLRRRISMPRIGAASGYQPALQYAFRGPGRAYCPRCERQVELLSYHGTALIFRADLEELDHLARQGELHRVHNRNGDVMLCSVSLSDCFARVRTREFSRA